MTWCRSRRRRMTASRRCGYAPTSTAWRSRRAPGRIVFALARGVLYALDQGSGHVRWATRVGVDTTTLPVRITPRAAAPELVLVLSSDTNTLTVRDVQTGKAIGRHRLSAPCLGRPLVIGPKAYLPTYDGRVYEIDLGAGTQVGWFELGKPLSIGGSRQEGTNLLYFPADERYVFIIDVAERKCPAMLLSDHPAGSLRSEPVIISRADQRRDRHLEESAFPDYLVLSQAAGLDSMKLRVFPLPIKPGVGKPATLGPEPEVPGWSWFPPFQNCERIVQVTDEGVVGLIGINQFRNQDKDLFLEMKYQIPRGKGRRPEGSGSGGAFVGRRRLGAGTRRPAALALRQIRAEPAPLVAAAAQPRFTAARCSGRRGASTGAGDAVAGGADLQGHGGEPDGRPRRRGDSLAETARPPLPRRAAPHRRPGAAARPGRAACSSSIPRTTRRGTAGKRPGNASRRVWPPPRAGHTCCPARTATPSISSRSARWAGLSSAATSRARRSSFARTRRSACPRVRRAASGRAWCCRSKTACWCICRQRGRARATRGRSGAPGTPIATCPASWRASAATNSSRPTAAEA